jgi:hypothetical protein
MNETFLETTGRVKALMGLVALSLGLAGCAWPMSA